MALTEIKIERYNSNADQVKVLAWHVEDGAEVSAGDPIADLETDKVTVNIDAPCGGFIRRLCGEGDRVSVGGVLACIAKTKKELSTLSSKPAQETQGEEDGVKATQGAKDFARRHQLPLAEIKKAGIITQKDVVAHFAPSLKNKKTGGNDARNIKELRTPTVVHQSMAERISRSHSDKVPAVLTAQWDLAPALKFLESKKASGKTYSLLDLAIHALGKTLPKYDLANSNWRADGIEVFASIHIGFTMDVKGELYTLTVFDADKKSIEEICVERNRVALALLRGKPDPKSTGGATFTISLLDAPCVFGQIAIIPPEQTAILGFGAVFTGPDGEARSQASLTYDHRVFSGKYASDFMTAFGKALREVV